MRRASLLAATVTTLVFIAGCGGSASTEDQIKSSFSDAARALADGNGEKFCSQLTEASRTKFQQSISQQTSGASCAEGVSSLIGAVKGLDSGNWNEFCAKIAKQAANSIAQAGAKIGGDGTCASGAKAVEATAQGKAIFKSLRNQLSSTFDRLKAAKLENLKVTGNKASATLAPAKKGEAPIRFEKVGDKWYLTD